MLPDRRRTLRGLLTFALLYAGLSLAARGMGHTAATSASELASRWIGGNTLVRDVDLRFAPAPPAAQAAASSVDRAWTIVLRAERIPTRAGAFIHINLRKAFWVPLAVFIALALASPIWRSARGWIVLLVGALALQLPFGLSAVINAAGLLYENYVIDLGESAQSALRFGYALLAPPGMVYALPLLLWAGLMLATRPRAAAVPDAGAATTIQRAQPIA